MPLPYIYPTIWKSVTLRNYFRKINENSPIRPIIACRWTFVKGHREPSFLFGRTVRTLRTAALYCVQPLYLQANIATYPIQYKTTVLSVLNVLSTLTHPGKSGCSLVNGLGRQVTRGVLAVVLAVLIGYS